MADAAALSAAAAPAPPLGKMGAEDLVSDEEGVESCAAPFGEVAHLTGYGWGVHPCEVEQARRTPRALFRGRAFAPFVFASV